MNNTVTLAKTSPAPSRLMFLEHICTVLAIPVLLFPTIAPLLTASILMLNLILWSLSWLFQHTTLPPTPLNGTLLLWSLMVFLGTLVSPFPHLTLPKVCGLLLGLIVWRYEILTLTGPQKTFLATIGLLVFGGIVAVVGFLSANWLMKIPLLIPLLNILPQRLLQLPEAPETGVSANQLAGALAFYIPLLISLLVTPHHSRRTFWKKVPLVIVIVVTIALLLLTASRSGWVGALAGLTVYIFLYVYLNIPQQYKPKFVSMSGLCFITGLGWLAFRWEQIASVWIDPPDITMVGSLGSLKFRQEVWRWALATLQDFPMTGCGLGTFRQVVRVLYPLAVRSDYDIAHAHNIFLQVALDTGVPGLIAYLALLALAARCAWQVARQQPAWRPLALGLLAGLVGLHVYGLTDALAPGSKPGLIFWAALGLLAALENPALPAARAEQMPESSGEAIG